MANVEIGAVGKIFSQKRAGQPFTPEGAEQASSVVKQGTDWRGNDENAKAYPQAVLERIDIFFRQGCHQVTYGIADGDTERGGAKQQQGQREKQCSRPDFVL